MKAQNSKLGDAIRALVNLVNGNAHDNQLPDFSVGEIIDIGNYTYVGSRVSNSADAWFRYFSCFLKLRKTDGHHVYEVVDVIRDIDTIIENGKTYQKNLDELESKNPAM